MTEAWTSRFFLKDDKAVQHFIVKLPESWWSRKYEYSWAAAFAEPNDTALDAASGISHPFKFYLADVCKDAYACDIDPRIESDEAIQEEISRDLNTAVDLDLIKKVHRAQANLTKLPYEDKQFDKIFCISVMEHLEIHVQKRVWEEFYRTLIPSGIVVLTFDYPTVDLKMLETLADLAGFEFAGSVQKNLPETAVSDDRWGQLYCFRAVFRKKKPPSIF